MLRRVIAIVAAIWLAPSVGYAASITFTYDVEYTGGDSPLGLPPWLTATFDDFGGTGAVQLTMSATNLTGFEFVTQWLFNLNPALNPSSLAFALQPGSTVAATSIGSSTNAFSAGGGSAFDILFSFPTAFGPARFSASDVSIYQIIGPGLLASSFDFTSVGGGSGPLLTSARVQGIGPTADGSGWITPVPEPGSLLLLSSGLAGIVARRSRRKKRSRES